ncbi:tyrosine-type recombinase/integrase [Pseudoalteromonas sp. APC 3356]|jgi:integrase|uniref:tyrosine-type recombinase/integrase n=1 Tax=unclassified Pseudoalteromonas TaxID=194690 RepID=UPI000304D541|nr:MULTISPECIES: tyrosine-type recombinase/integrase [unclassified Pseudoalteromonas]MBB1410224.1 tyrosine-type recombinase/integrase [Pseudoalteromonas sp. SG44-17]MDN3436361.1 tyrosine-type recombinase/integrase [Pseudoalteromonas sp. APC 3356]
MKPELNHNATGVKRPFKLEEIWRIRTRIEIQNNLMQLALLNLAIDSKLRSCDLLSLKVRDVATHDQVFERVQLTQKKTGIEVQFEITPRTQQSISLWVQEVKLQPSDYLFRSLRRSNQPISYSYYRSIIRSWAEQLGLDSDLYGTHSMRRTKATLVYARTKNIRAVQLLLGHTKIDNTIRYLGIEIEDAIKISRETDC